MSLLLALIFVALFGGALTSIAAFNAYQIRQNEAKVAGREIVEIAKAARLYVRDRMITEPTLRVTAQVPSQITIATLKTAGYLSANFGRSYAGQDMTALGQPIHIIMANWPLGGSPTLDTTVPTAFVYIEDSGKSNPQMMISAVEVARSENSSITAPMFDASGDNVSADCRGGGPAVSLWDTGCLTKAEFTQLLAGVPSPPSNFEAGSLVIPVWKVVQPDLRAVMRFPQPENPGFATMLTDLHMGKPVDNCANSATQLQITASDTSGNPDTVSSGLCDVDTDTVAENKRFNINGIRNLSLQRLIAAPQQADFGGDDPDIGTGNEDGLRVTGNLTLGNDLRIYNREDDIGWINMPTALQNGSRPADQQLTYRMNVPNGTMVAERNVYAYSTNINRAGIATIGTVTKARKLVADRMTTPVFNSTQASTYTAAPPPNAFELPMIDVTETTILSAGLTVAGPTAELITEELNANTAAGPDDAATALNEVRTGAAMVATDLTGQVGVTGILDTHGGRINIDGANPLDHDLNAATPNYAAVIGEMADGGAIVATDTITYTGGSNTVTVTADSVKGYGGTRLPTIAAVRCKTASGVLNACPYRQYVPPGITP